MFALSLKHRTLLNSQAMVAIVVVVLLLLLLLCFFCFFMYRRNSDEQAKKDPNMVLFSQTSKLGLHATGHVYNRMYVYADGDPKSKYSTATKSKKSVVNEVLYELAVSDATQKAPVVPDEVMEGDNLYEMASSGNAALVPLPVSDDDPALYDMAAGGVENSTNEDDNLYEMASSELAVTEQDPAASDEEEQCVGFTASIASEQARA